jgi:undecaprenyl-diphosphatase
MLQRLLSVARTREWTILLALLAPAAAIWAIAELADEVLEGETHAVDTAILLSLRSPLDPAEPIGPDWFQEMMRDFTALGSTGVLTLITVAAAGYLLTLAKPKAALAVVLAVGGGMLISSIVKMGIDRPRPDLVPHDTYVVTASFPSGHSMMATVVYLTLAAMIARVRPGWRTRLYLLFCAVLVSLLVGVSRVYLGVHWPTDVLAGWTMGSGWAILCWTVMVWLQKRGEVEREDA